MLRRILRQIQRQLRPDPEFFLLLSLCIAGMTVTMVIGFIARVLFEMNQLMGLGLTLFTATVITASVCWVLWWQAPQMRLYLWLPILLLFAGAVLAWT